MGVSIVSHATISKELKLGTLAAIELNPPIERPVSFVHQKQKFRQRAMDELLEFLQQYSVKFFQNPSVRNIVTVKNSKICVSFYQNFTCVQGN